MPVPYQESKTSLAETVAQRGGRYGDFTGHASVSQTLKRVAYEHAARNGVVLSDVHVEGLDMIFHKIARIVNGDPNYADSWHDIAGYATIVEQRLPGNVSNS